MIRFKRILWVLLPAALLAAVIVSAQQSTGINGSGGVAGSTPAVVYVNPQSNADVAINSAITSLNAQGGGVVQLAAGTYNWSSSTSPVALKSGVSVVGVVPILNYATNTSPIPDASNVLANGGGTVINCAGGPCFQWNKASLGSPASANAFTVSGITNAGIRNIGFTNCSRAVDAGNTNNPAGWYLEFSNLYISGCTDWGFWITNFMHSTFNRIWAVNNVTGQMFFGNDVASSILQPGNSVWSDIYANTGATNTNLQRGMVFFVTQGNQNEATLYRIQSNRNGASVVTQAATMANTSANITVTDGTKFAVGMPVSFSATVNGFTQNQIYFVVSVATNVLQVSNTVGGAAVTATGATAVNITTSGFAALELVAASGAALLSHHFLNIDVENGGTCAAVLQNVQASSLSFNQFPSTSQSTISLCERNTTFSQVFTQSAANTDIDAASTTSAFYGFRAAGSVQRNPPGNYLDQGVNSQWFQNFTGAVLGFTDTTTGDTSHVIMPGTGVGAKITQVTAATTTLQAQNSGLVINTFTGGASTWTLPSLSTSTGNGQYIYDIVNAGSNAITLNSNAAGQTFNNKAGLVSLTISVNAGLRIAGLKDANGNSYWAVVGVAGSYAAGTVTGL